MRRTVPILAALSGLVAALQLLTAPAPAAEAVVPNDRQLCAAAATRTEAKLRLPANLLKAMTAVESGFWPWAVRARGTAHMMPSRQAAVSLIRQLHRQGVKDIMVGCLQIHLRYHPEAFASLEQALEPAANAAYAGGYLKSLVDDASWWDAVARYQGGKPAARRAYVQKVASAFRAGAPLPAARAGTGRTRAVPVVVVDAGFGRGVEGVLDMTPFVNLSFASGDFAMAALGGPHIF